MLGGKEVIALQPCLSQSTNRIPSFNSPDKFGMDSWISGIHDVTLISSNDSIRKQTWFIGASLDSGWLVIALSSLPSAIEEGYP